jgi:beta-N-acetylhexosaminidase
MYRLLFFLFCLVLFPACHGQKKEPQEPEVKAEVDANLKRSFDIASSMDDSILVSQILMTGIEGKGSLSAGMLELLELYPAGGVMLFRYNLDTDNDSIRALISQTVSLIEELSGTPPFVAVDHEGGSVNRFISGLAKLPPAYFYHELAQKEGKQIALAKIEADVSHSAAIINWLGFNMNFAPVAELLNDDNRTFLDDRSYGSDPVFTAEAAGVFVRAMRDNGVLCVIKHFPASAGPDPHYSPSVITGNKAALNALVSPFAALIKDGVRAVMIAHSQVPAMDKDRIASLSPVVMQNWLREDLSFGGLIISDDFIMAAAGDISSEEAAVQSVAAGADMILVWPRDLKRTHEAFISALNEERLSRGRLTEAASRVIYEKIRLGLINE